MTKVPPTRAELLAALEDHNPDNPLAVAIGAIPNSVVLPMPQTELEAFALELLQKKSAAWEFASR